MKVKKMNLISQAEGNVFAIAALLNQQNKLNSTSGKLFKLAMTNFQMAIDATPGKIQCSKRIYFFLPKKYSVIGKIMLQFWWIMQHIWTNMQEHYLYGRL